MKDKIDIVLEKEIIEENILWRLPMPCNAHSMKLFIDRVIRVYGSAAELTMENETTMKITVSRLETDEECLIRRLDSNKKKKIKYQSNIKNGFFKMIGRKR